MTDWQLLTQPRPAQIKSANFICDATELGLILVNGEDAESFLQNQFSNDISQIDESHFQLSSCSTAKGRMLAIFQVVRIASGFILITPLSMVTPFLQRLQMFVVGSKVTLADASGHFTRMALQSDLASIADHPLLPREQGEVIQNDSLVSLQLSSLGQQKSYLLLCLSLDEATSLWNEFSQHLQVSIFAAWRLSQISCGIPAIYPQTSEEFVLQMANLDLLEAVSFKKGCYPGQEIVARMHYLGKLKKRLFLSRFKIEKCPLPGADIIASGATQPDGSGKVLDAVIDEKGICHCLYVAQIKKALAGKLCLFDQPSIELTQVKLPYLVPELQN